MQRMRRQLERCMSGRHHRRVRLRLLLATGLAVHTLHAPAAVIPGLGRRSDPMGSTPNTGWPHLRRRTLSGGNRDSPRDTRQGVVRHLLPAGSRWSATGGSPRRSSHGNEVGCTATAIAPVRLTPHANRRRHAPRPSGRSQRGVAGAALTGRRTDLQRCRAAIARRRYRLMLWTRWGRDWSRRRRRVDRREGKPSTSDGDVILLPRPDHYSAPGSWRRLVAALRESRDLASGGHPRSRSVTADLEPIGALVRTMVCRGPRCRNRSVGGSGGRARLRTNIQRRSRSATGSCGMCWSPCWRGPRPDRGLSGVGKDGAARALARS